MICLVPLIFGCSVIAEQTSGASSAAPEAKPPSQGRVIQDPAMKRPAYNSGDGFFVLDGELYDADGHPFRIRGVNRVHWDSDSAAGIARSHANAVRWNVDFSRPAAENVALVRAQSIRSREVPIVGNWDGTCSSDPAKLAAMVSSWVAQARQWRRIERYFILNVANEWGPADSTVWRDAYVAALGRLRAAGYRGTILIDSGGCGQDMQDLDKYSQAVFNADPQRNVVFAVHLYGGTNEYSASIRAVSPGNPTFLTLEGASPTHPFAPGFNGSNNSYSGIWAYQISGALGMQQLNGVQYAMQNVGGMPGAWTVTLAVDSSHWAPYRGGGRLVDANGNLEVRMTSLAALAHRTGAVYIVGEFGPGRDVGPSPTTVTAAQVITTAEEHGIGWLAWAWDDNNLPGGASDDRWFSMTYHGPGLYQRTADLTEFGHEVVLDPHHGLQALAQPASIYRRGDRPDP